MGLAMLQEAARAQRERQAFAQSCCKRMLNWQAAQALSAWHSFAAHRMLLKQRVAPILSQWLSLRLRAGFNAFLLQVGWSAHWFGQPTPIHTA